MQSDSEIRPSETMHTFDPSMIEREQSIQSLTGKSHDRLLCIETVPADLSLLITLLLATSTNLYDKYMTQQQ